jgi:hypothetical protein
MRVNPAAWLVAGCSKTEEAQDLTGKAQSLEVSVRKRTPKKGAPAGPAPTQRVKTGRE